ncbi:MAG: hypothetical protein ABIJ93_04070 [candidate division WOR-3 bacterium]
MAKKKSGDVLYCEKCGVEVMVTKECGYEQCEIYCCDKPMKKKEKEEPKRYGGCCCGGF